MPRPTKPEIPKSNEHKESRIGRFFVPVKQFFRGLSPSVLSKPKSCQTSPDPAPKSEPVPGTTTSSSLELPAPKKHQQTVTTLVRDERQVASDLWFKACNQLPEGYKTNLVNLDKLDILQKLFEIATQAKEQASAKQLKLTWGDREIDVREKAEGFLGLVHKFKEIGDIVMQYDPVHAALPWAAVRFILMVCDPDWAPPRSGTNVAIFV